MVILVIVSHVLILWFAISFFLGLCWATACLVAPKFKRWRNRSARPAVLRATVRPVRLPVSDAEAKASDQLVDEVGSPAVALPRRFAPHTRPAREALTRAQQTARSQSERA